jgi:fibronectin type 3 domain-containing protein
MTKVSANQAGVSFSDSGLTPSTAYFYKVVAVNSAGSSVPSSEATATTLAPPVVAPAAPANVGAAADSSTAITVSWTAASGATGYDVYRSATAGHLIAVMTKVSANQAGVSFSDSGLTPSTAYFYKVVAVNSAGSGPASLEATATTQAPPVVAPAAPTAVGAIAGSSIAITVSWTPASGATGYDVYRSATAGQLIAVMTKISVNQPGVSSSDSGLMPSTAYYYKVVALNSAGPSAPSAEATATTQAPPVVAPSAPTGVGAIATSSTTITLSWAASAGATGYDVYRSTTPGVVISQSNKTSGNQAGLSYSDAGLAPSTAYYYKVVALNSAGPSPASSEATATTQAPAVVAPAAPTGVVAAATGSNSITVTWTPSAGATGYDVYRSASPGQALAAMTKISFDQAGFGFPDSGLSPSTAYYYKVVALNSAGPSVASAEATATTSAPTSFSLGGTLSGLAGGQSVTLLNNGSNPITLSVNGPFAFTAGLPTNVTFKVTVASATQNCAVTAGGTGTVNSANITSVMVGCGPGTFIGAYGMGFGRVAHTSTLLPGGKVLVVAGDDPIYVNANNQAGGMVEIFDPTTGTWSGTNNYPDPVQGHTATLLSNGKVLVTGGVTPVNNNTVPAIPAYVLAAAQLFTPATETWAPAAPMGAVRYGHTATLLPNGKVLVTGGLDAPATGGGVARASAELYDPASGTWANAPSMGSARTNHSALLLPNGKVLVFGAAPASTSAELYDPTTNTWAAAAPMATPRICGSNRGTAASGTLLADGRVLVAGGASGPSSAFIEIYDFTTNTWTTVGNILISKTLILLPNGKLLERGTSTARFYDPVANTWTAADGGIALRAVVFPTATLLANGRVLFCGGTPGPTSSAEIYW